MDGIFNNQWEIQGKKTRLLSLIYGINDEFITAKLKISLEKSDICLLKHWLDYLWQQNKEKPLELRAAMAGKVWFQYTLIRNN